MSARSSQRRAAGASIMRPKISCNQGVTILEGPATTTATRSGSNARKHAGSNRSAGSTRPSSSKRTGKHQRTVASHVVKHANLVLGDSIPDDVEDIKFTNIESSSSDLSQRSKHLKEITAGDILKMTQEDDYKNVYEIDLRACQLGVLPNLEKFRKVRMLDLSSNFIQRISALECCSDLRDLKLYDNCLESIEKLDSLTELTSLQLQHNKIKAVGRGLVNLRKLTVLRLDCNSLLKIEPKELAALSRLTHLNLSNNKLDSVSAVNSLPNLQELLLSTNRLKSFDISRCKKIVELDLSRNRLQDLNSIQTLSSLQILNVSKNAISKLDVPTVMNSLEELYISGNTVRRLSSICKAFPCLEILDITQNKISNFTEVEALAAVGTLRELSALENPFCDENAAFPAYHQTITNVLPQIQVLDGAVVKHSGSDQRHTAPLMRPMSASHVVSSRQVQSHLDMLESEMLNITQSLEQKFASLRARVDQLPIEPPDSARSQRPSSKCSRRSRIMEARAFAENHFDNGN